MHYREFFGGKLVFGLPPPPCPKGITRLNAQAGFIWFNVTLPDCREAYCPSVCQPSLFIPPARVSITAKLSYLPNSLARTPALRARSLRFRLMPNCHLSGFHPDFLNFFPHRQRFAR